MSRISIQVFGLVDQFRGFERIAFAGDFESPVLQAEAFRIGVEWWGGRSGNGPIGSHALGVLVSASDPQYRHLLKIFDPSLSGGRRTEVVRAIATLTYDQFALINHDVDRFWLIDQLRDLSSFCLDPMCAGECQWDVADQDLRQAGSGQSARQVLPSKAVVDSLVNAIPTVLSVPEYDDELALAILQAATALKMERNRDTTFVTFSFATTPIESKADIVVVRDSTVGKEAWKRVIGLSAASIVRGSPPGGGDVGQKISSLEFRAESLESRMGPLHGETQKIGALAAKIMATENTLSTFSGALDSTRTSFRRMKLVGTTLMGLLVLQTLGVCGAFYFWLFRPSEGTIVAPVSDASDPIQHELRERMSTLEASVSELRRDVDRSTQDGATTVQSASEVSPVPAQEAQDTEPITPSELIQNDEDRGVSAVTEGAVGRSPDGGTDVDPAIPKPEN